MPSEFLKSLISTASDIAIEREGEIKAIIASLLSRGHILMEGVPGVAKTLTAKIVASLLDLKFQRIQMTPDLLPSDILGGYIYDQKSGEFKLRHGPIFANVVLVDEINRASPRTQSALLEAMQERQVTIEGTTIRLEEPFMVIATQNPIEFEGVFPLPEAQLDRFFIKIDVGYTSRKGLIEIVRRIDEIEEKVSSLRPIVGREYIIEAMKLVKQVRIDDSIYEYIATIVEATRTHPAVRLGGSPRAAIAMARMAKAWAYLDGRNYVIPDDVKHVAPLVLSHRLVIKPEYEIEGMRAETVVRDVLSRVQVPRP